MRVTGMSLDLNEGNFWKPPEEWVCLPEQLTINSETFSPGP